MSVNQQYLRDKQDNIFSPITSVESVYDENGNPIKNALLNMFYPIGSIYMSVNSTNPQTLFGGTWVAWGSGRVPVGVNSSDTDFQTVEKTGGSKTHTHTQGATGSHTLTVEEIPKHSHIIWNSNAGGPYESENGNVFPETGNSNKSWGYEMITQNTGGGQGHTHTNPNTAASSSLQPYITCYMWKRTA